MALTVVVAVIGTGVDANTYQFRENEERKGEGRGEEGEEKGGKISLRCYLMLHIRKPTPICMHVLFTFFSLQFSNIKRYNDL